jgi:hypothetical protein
LLAKLQERRGGNQKVKLILFEPCSEDPRVIFITRGGGVIGEDKMTLGKTTDGSRIIKYVEKTQLFDQRKEKNIFEEARREFVGEHASSSRAQPKVREREMSPTFHQSTLARQGKEVSKLMDFLYTCINLIKDEKDV